MRFEVWEVVSGTSRTYETDSGCFINPHLVFQFFFYYFGKCKMI